MSNIEAGYRAYRLLNKNDAWGSSWVDNPGGNNQAANANLRNWLSHGTHQEQPWFVTNKAGKETLQGTNGASYRPAYGYVVGIWSTSSAITKFEARDYFGNIAVVGLTRNVGFVPVYLTAQRTDMSGDDSDIFVLFAERNFTPPRGLS